MSSEGGGFIRVTSGAYTLFAQPRAFKVLLDGGYRQAPGTSDVIGYNYQIYGTGPWFRRLLHLIVSPPASV